MSTFTTFIITYINYYKNNNFNIKFSDLVDILAASAINNDATSNEPLQPNRGNKISKKNKKKNKNQDWDDESEGKKYFDCIYFTNY